MIECCCFDKPGEGDEEDEEEEDRRTRVVKREEGEDGTAPLAWNEDDEEQDPFASAPGQEGQVSTNFRILFLRLCGCSFLKFQH